MNASARLVILIALSAAAVAVGRQRYAKPALPEVTIPAQSPTAVPESSAPAKPVPQRTVKPSPPVPSSTVTTDPPKEGPSPAPASATPSGPHVTLIRAGQLQTTVQFRTYVDDADGGRCELTYVGPGGATASAVGTVGADAGGASGCLGLDLAASAFKPAGSWSGTLVVTATDGKTARLQADVAVSP